MSKKPRLSITPEHGLRILETGPYGNFLYQNRKALAELFDLSLVLPLLTDAKTFWETDKCAYCEALGGLASYRYKQGMLPPVVEYLNSYSSEVKIYCPSCTMATPVMQGGNDRKAGQPPFAAIKFWNNMQKNAAQLLKECSL